MKSERSIWLNGQMRPESAAVVSIYDSAMMYGDSLFEMLRSYRLKHFRVEDHLDRLLAGAVTLGIPTPTKKEMLGALDELDRANEKCWAADDEIRTLITVSRGTLPLYLHLESRPWLMITQYPLRWVLRGRSRLYRHGVHCISTSIPGFAHAQVPGHLKHHNRIHFRLAEQEAATMDPEAWALVHDGTEAQRPVEATGANLFVVRNGILRTPPLIRCLPGISRRMVIELAAKLGIAMRLSPLEPNGAEEAFATCTPFGIVPWTRWNDQTIGPGMVGPLTTTLMQAWNEAVGMDAAAQAEAWDRADGQVG